MVLAGYTEKQGGFLGKGRWIRLGLGGTGSTGADGGAGVAKAYIQ